MCVNFGYMASKKAAWADKISKKILMWYILFYTDVNSYNNCGKSKGLRLRHIKNWCQKFILNIWGEKKVRACLKK